MIWGEKEEQGYNSLIRSSIYQKSQIPIDNKHEEYGLLLSSQTEYVLREIYSGTIQKRYQDIQQYTRFVFDSRHCSSLPDNQLICLDRSDIND